MPLVTPPHTPQKTLPTIEYGGISSVRSKVDTVLCGWLSPEDLVFVAKLYDKILPLITAEKDPLFVTRTAKIFYSFLTTRGEVFFHEWGIGEIVKKYEPQKMWYRKMREEMEKAIERSSEMTWESNPGWFGIDTHPEIQEWKDENHKVYYTIPPTHYAFIRNIPLLARKMRSLAISAQDKIHIKIPESFSGFVANNDSIVIHFKNPENALRINQMVVEWMKEYEIPQTPRQYNRAQQAKDGKGTSFTDLVANNIAEWLGNVIGKYPPEVLANLAIEHLLRQAKG